MAGVVVAGHVELVRDVAAGEFVKISDVAFDENLQAVRIRHEMEREARATTDAMSADHRAVAEV